MADDKSVAVPLVISLVLVVAALAIATMGGGILKGSILGGLLALAAAVPAGYAAWKGTQGDKQQRLLGGMVLMLISLGVAAVLIVAKIIDWVR
jgi:hypothetical protein